MTEQEQAVAFLKQEWDNIISDIQSNANQINRNLQLINRYSTIRDSLSEEGYDISEAKKYELTGGYS
jgi:flagellar biosynthesis regulator FlaF